MSDTTELTIDRSKLQVSDEVAIEVSNMNKWYGTFHVLRDINLTVQRGERILGRPIWVWKIHFDPLHEPSGRASAGSDHRRRH